VYLVEKALQNCHIPYQLTRYEDGEAAMRALAHPIITCATRGLSACDSTRGPGTCGGSKNCLDMPTQTPGLSIIFQSKQQAG
jgi:hypothetical protein